MTQKIHSIFTVRILICCILSALLANTTQAEVVGDFDGDGKTDLLVRRRNPQDDRLHWFALRSGNNSFSATQWGFDAIIPGIVQVDIPVMGDYDGDGKTDIAVYRRRLTSPPTPTFFYILRSSDGTFQSAQWGLSDDAWIPQDYDGDGKTDIAVTRFTSQGTSWFVLGSRDGYFVVSNPVGGTAVRGDYDGDGKADYAVVKSSPNSNYAQYFHILKSSTGRVETTQFGNGFNDYVVPGDYDGDGKTDIAVWGGKNENTSGRWIWKRSSDGNWESVRFGTGRVNQDYAVPGDYDGDGKTDPAFYRQPFDQNEQSHFYILSSRSQGYYTVPWGLGTDGAPLWDLQAR